MVKPCDCGCTERELCDERGEYNCVNCGRVVGVDEGEGEVEFLDDEKKGKIAVGNYIPNKSAKSSIYTLTKARAIIDRLCEQLHLGDAIASHAISVYKTALRCHMTKGRTREITAASCVYLAARVKGTSVIMADLCDILSIPLSKLYHVYDDIRLATGRIVNGVDPCELTERFAGGLQLGSDSLTVAQTAIRILHRMRQEWMSSGMKPASVAVTAVFIAARMYNYERSVEDTVKSGAVVGVTMSTVRRRIKEWESSRLSKLQLVDIDDDNESSLLHQPVVDKCNTVTSQRKRKYAKKVGAEVSRIDIDETLDALYGDDIDDNDLAGSHFSEEDADIRLKLWKARPENVAFCSSDDDDETNKNDDQSEGERLNFSTAKMTRLPSSIEGDSVDCDDENIDDIDSSGTMSVHVYEDSY